MLCICIHVGAGGGIPLIPFLFNSRFCNVFVKSVAQGSLAPGCICLQFAHFVIESQLTAELYSFRLALDPSLIV